MKFAIHTLIDDIDYNLINWFKRGIKMYNKQWEGLSVIGNPFLYYYIWLHII